MAGGRLVEKIDPIGRICQRFLEGIRIAQLKVPNRKVKVFKFRIIRDYKRRGIQREFFKRFPLIFCGCICSKNTVAQLKEWKESSPL